MVRADLRKASDGPKANLNQVLPGSQKPCVIATVRNYPRESTVFVLRARAGEAKFMRRQESSNLLVLWMETECIYEGKSKFTCTNCHIQASRGT